MGTVTPSGSSLAILLGVIDDITPKRLQEVLAAKNPAEKPRTSHQNRDWTILDRYNMQYAILIN